MIKPYKFSDCVAEKYPADSKAAILRQKIDNGEKLTDEEKIWITESVRSNSYSRTGIPVMGWMIPFSDVLKLYWFEWYDDITKAYAFNKTTLRKVYSGKIGKIVEVK